MFVDASAIVAILAEEAGWQELFKRLSSSSGQLYVSPLVRFEASQAVARKSAGGRKPSSGHLAQARDEVDRFILEAGAETIAVNEEIGTRAIDASMRYGKAVGHPADLNFGDCFAYACAKELNVPLLYKGNDFSHTDIAWIRS